MDGNRALAAVDAWTRERPWVADTVLACLLAAVLLPGSAGPVVDGDWALPGTAAVIAVLVAAHAALVLRRTAPRTVFAIVCAAMLALVCLPDLGGAVTGEYDGPLPPILLPSALVFPCALYTLAAHAPPRVSLAGLGIAGAGAVVSAVRLGTSDLLSGGPSAGDGGLPALWALMLVPVLAGCTVAPWSLGRFRRVRAQHVLSLEERARLEQQGRDRHAREAIRSERTRIAREMHDVVSHSLAVMVSQAEGGRMMATKDPTVTVPVLDTVARTGQEAMRGMRGLLDALDPEGAGTAAPQPRLADVTGVVERVREAGVPVDLRIDREPADREDRLDVGAELAAYRVVQEALTNVLRHAPDATQVSAGLVWTPGSLEVRVRNDGVDHMGTCRSGGRGIPGMRQRVDLVGGTSRIGPAGEGWFEVHASIPRSTA